MFGSQKTTNKIARKSFDWRQLVPRTESDKEKFVWALIITCCVPFIAQQADAATLLMKSEVTMMPTIE
jgi:hypothetical protein